MSKILIFDVKNENVRDSYFLCSMMSNMVIFDLQWGGTAKIIIIGYINVKDNDNQHWKLLDVKYNYFTRFVLEKINILTFRFPQHKK